MCITNILKQVKFFGIIWLIFLCSCNNSKYSYEPLPEIVDFNFHIRPILVQNCYLCHGPDPSSRKANLRLDTFEGATAALKDGGYSIVPSKPNQSVLISRIHEVHPDKIMPPPETNMKLTNREKSLIEKWIKQGAEWKSHWSFIPPKLEESYKDANIDLFIDEYLEERGLRKSPVANKNTLIRRVSYLITGLPPKPKEIEAYLLDTSESAYQNMVDYYLNSTAYGERWARHWMDLMRYAETKGHEFDFSIIGAWQYRDYLIRAFNNDVPYDQFLKEHIAGDLMEDKRYNPENGILESHLGTAFYDLGEGLHSPVDIKLDEAQRIDNIIDVTTKTFQGLTVSCAKCHDHKFDPIPTTDYYALYGIIESTRFSYLDSDRSISKEKVAEALNKTQDYINAYILEKIDDKIGKTTSINESEKRQSEIDNFKYIGDFRGANLDGWIKNGLAFGKTTTLGNPIFDKSSGRLIKLDEGRASSKEGVMGALRSPNFTIDSNFLEVRLRGKQSSVRVIIDNFQLIKNPIYGGLFKSVENSLWKDYKFDLSAWKGHKAYIEIFPGKFSPSQKINLTSDAFVEAQYAITYNSKKPLRVPLKEGMVSSVTAVNKKNKFIKKERFKFPELIVKVDSVKTLSKRLKSGELIRGVSDGFAINSPVFIRGNHKELSEKFVPRRFLSVLPQGGIPFDAKGSGRLQFAKAMLHKDNPLTSRVMVNRIWHHLFGRGLVETVDNFGLQGKLPSHPKLLDHLAIRFKNEDWSVKKMIKYIVTSEVFKRSTKAGKDVLKNDPNNIFLAAFPIRRIESEAIRDGILAVSESLDSTSYGPPVPVYLSKFMKGRGRPKKSGPMNGKNRRSIYQEVRRNFLNPMMNVFDRPIPFTTFGKRDVTNVPSQSLTLMNNPLVIQQSEIMAKKMLADKDLSFNQKVEWVYIRAFARKPTMEEINKASDFIKTIKKVKTEEVEKGDVAIWKEYCHTIFNLKEFIYLK